MSTLATPGDEHGISPAAPTGSTPWSDRYVEALAGRLSAGLGDADGSVQRAAVSVLTAARTVQDRSVTVLVVATHTDDVQLTACRIQEWLNEIRKSNGRLVISSPSTRRDRRLMEIRLAWCPDLAQKPLRWAGCNPEALVGRRHGIRVVGTIHGSVDILNRLWQAYRTGTPCDADQDFRVFAPVRALLGSNQAALRAIEHIDAVCLAWNRNQRALIGAGDRYADMARELAARTISGWAHSRWSRRHRAALLDCFAGDRGLYHNWLVTQMASDDLMPVKVAAAWLYDEAVEQESACPA